MNIRDATPSDLLALLQKADLKKDIAHFSSGGGRSKGPLPSLIEEDAACVRIFPKLSDDATYMPFLFVCSDDEDGNSIRVFRGDIEAELTSFSSKRSASKSGHKVCNRKVTRSIVKQWIKGASTTARADPLSKIIQKANLRMDNAPPHFMYPNYYLESLATPRTTSTKRKANSQSQSQSQSQPDSQPSPKKAKKMVHDYNEEEDKFQRMLDECDYDCTDNAASVFGEEEEEMELENGQVEQTPQPDIATMKRSMQDTIHTLFEPDSLRNLLRCDVGSHSSAVALVWNAMMDRAPQKCGDMLKQIKERGLVEADMMAVLEKTHATDATLPVELPMERFMVCLLAQLSVSMQAHVKQRVPEFTRNMVEYVNGFVEAQCESLQKYVVEGQAFMADLKKKYETQRERVAQLEAENEHLRSTINHHQQRAQHLYSLLKSTSDQVLRHHSIQFCAVTPDNAMDNLYSAFSDFQGIVMRMHQKKYGARSPAVTSPTPQM